MKDTSMDFLFGKTTFFGTLKENDDALTHFAPTRLDLVALASKLADELLGWDFSLRLNASLRDIDMQDYIGFRLGRVLNHLYANDAEKIREKIQVGLLDNEEGAQRVIEEWSGETARVKR
jgi:hypothetical protein